MRGVEVVYLRIVAEECVTVDSARAVERILRTEGLQSAYGQGKVVEGGVARTSGCPFSSAPERNESITYPVKIFNVNCSQLVFEWRDKSRSGMGRTTAGARPPLIVRGMATASG